MTLIELCTHLKYKRRDL